MGSEHTEAPLFQYEAKMFMMMPYPNNVDSNEANPWLTLITSALSQCDQPTRMNIY